MAVVVGIRVAIKSQHLAAVQCPNKSEIEIIVATRALAEAVTMSGQVKSTRDAQPLPSTDRGARIPGTRECGYGKANGMGKNAGD